MSRGTAKLVAVVLFVSCRGNESRDKPQSEPVVAARGPVPRVSIPAGTYLGSEPACLPDAATWRSAASNPFVIDKMTAHCEDYDACTRAGACVALDRGFGTQDCRLGQALLTLDEAAAFCRWRGMSLPTFGQLQRSLRGPNWSAEATAPIGSALAECDHGAMARQVTGCVHTSDFGVDYWPMGLSWGEWTSDTTCATDGGDLPVVYDESHLRLDRYTSTLTKMFAARCVSVSQP